ncbi:heme peroxidase [Endogone sp. FLAS-F59071]|nr:heme peroxidase [Endogone sp. FLAS-F59071]|eukprot:RUS17744.1 heme peroxidase [Endogone sp. FLAS-F59071]
MSVGDVVNGQLEIINKNNGWVDFSLIYSDNQTQSSVLCTHTDGMLWLRNWIADGRAYANFTTADTNGVVDSDIAALPPMDPQYLMVSGDVRASEDIPLTVLYTIFIREHNYQAVQYQEIFPNATDEQLFQLARCYTIGEYQKIMYEEYLPVTLGQVLPTYTGYKSTINPGTSTAFAAGAFRYGHSTAWDYDIYDGCSPSGESLLELYDNTDLFSFLNTTISGTRLFFQGQIFVLAGVQGTTQYDYEPAHILALMGGRYGDGFDNLISSLIRQRLGKFDPMLHNIVGGNDLHRHHLSDPMA